MSRPVDDRLSAWLDGALDPAEAAEVERLVRDDPAWGRRAEELRALSSALRAPVDDDALPPGFHSRARARFEATQRLHTWGAVVWRWRFAGAAVAALLLIAIFLPVSIDPEGGLRAPETESRPAPPPRQETGVALGDETIAADPDDDALPGRESGEARKPPPGSDAPATKERTRRQRVDASKDRAEPPATPREEAREEMSKQATTSSAAPPAPEPRTELEAGIQGLAENDVLRTTAAPRVRLAPGWPAAGFTRIVRDRAELEALRPERGGAEFLAWLEGWDGRSPLLLAGAPAGRLYECATEPVEVGGALEFRVRVRAAAPGTPGAGCAIAPGPLDRPATIRIVEQRP